MRALFLILFCLASTVQSRAQTAGEQQQFERATRALTSSDYRAAEDGFLAVLKSSPRNVGALGNLGVVYSRTNQLDKAIAVYKRALTVAPGDRQLLLNLGLAYLREEAHGEALPIFRELFAKSPADPRIRELLATSELYAGDADRAVTLLGQAQGSRDPAAWYLLGVGYLKLRDKERARQAFDAMLTTAPPPRAALVLCKAYYDAGDLEAAESQCRSALKADSKLDGVHRELGKVLVSRREAGAEDELRAAVQADAADAEAQYFLGAWLVQNDKPTEAVAHLDEARRLNPGFWGNYFYLGRARLATADHTQGISLLEKAAELNSSESAIYYQLGRAYAAAGKLVEAKSAMKRVQELKARDLAAESRSLR